jgi:hypothetical protein
MIRNQAMPFNVAVAHQDRRVVETHQPQRPGLRIGEKMIPGDRPIVEYRRRREALIEAARQGSGELLTRRPRSDDGHG